MYKKILQENPQLSNACVLIADDSEISRKICEKFLREAGFTNIHFADDGNHALEMVKSLLPDLLVCDIFMPGYTGFDLIRILKEDEDTKNIPILVHTASTSSKDVNEAFIKGATDVVQKPVQREEFLSRVSMHLENSQYRRRIREELDKAKILQKSIIPSAKKLSEIKAKTSVDTGYIFQPTSEVGGDFWGAKQISDKLIAIYCVDLTGHGIASAMNTFRVHSLIEENLNAKVDLGEFLNKINAVLCEIMPTGQYATLFFGIIDVEKNKIFYSNAGAPYPIMIKKDASVVVLKSGALPLGVSAEAKYQILSEDFNKDDVLLVFSDALNETANPHGDFFTDEKIAKTLAKLTDKGAQDIADSLYSRFTTFVGRNIFDDDLTINIYKKIG